MSEPTFTCYCCDKEITATEALAVAQRIANIVSDPKLDEDVKCAVGEMGVHMMGPDSNFADFKCIDKSSDDPALDEFGPWQYPIEIRPYIHDREQDDGWECGWGVFCKKCLQSTLKEWNHA